MAQMCFFSLCVLYLFISFARSLFLQPSVPSHRHSVQTFYSRTSDQIHWLAFSTQRLCKQRTCVLYYILADRNKSVNFLLKQRVIRVKKSCPPNICVIIHASALNSKIPNCVTLTQCSLLTSHHALAYTHTYTHTYSKVCKLPSIYLSAQQALVMATELGFQHVSPWS